MRDLREAMMSSFETKDIPFMTLSKANKGRNCTFIETAVASLLSMLRRTHGSPGLIVAAKDHAPIVVIEIGIYGRPKEPVALRRMKDEPPISTCRKVG